MNPPHNQSRGGVRASSAAKSARNSFASERIAFARRAPFEFIRRDGGSAAHITLSHTSASFHSITE
jgi:hypothetical protein